MSAFGVLVSLSLFVGGPPEPFVAYRKVGAVYKSCDGVMKWLACIRNPCLTSNRTCSNFLVELNALSI